MTRRPLKATANDGPGRSENRHLPRQVPKNGLGATIVNKGGVQGLGMARAALDRVQRNHTP
ncbi:hypothetical protein HMPREF0185_00582 [Brevundimonas diminuta 470-4]|nr:hypothetical protein HMPREF0185_00582 [Brevundimonas diminuta 470-4]